MISHRKRVLSICSLVKITNRKGEGRFYFHVPQVNFGQGTALPLHKYQVKIDFRGLKKRNGDGPNERDVREKRPQVDSEAGRGQREVLDRG